MRMGAQSLGGFSSPSSLSACAFFAFSSLELSLPLPCGSWSPSSFSFPCQLPPERQDTTTRRRAALPSVLPSGAPTKPVSCPQPPPHHPCRTPVPPMHPLLIPFPSHHLDRLANEAPAHDPRLCPSNDEEMAVATATSRPRRGASGA